jgi:diguanylate cyclase (GGDEF)-like protein/PAS domain S-box-containing protein
MKHTRIWKAATNPVLRLTFGIVSLTAGLLLVAQLLGFLPDRSGLELDARQKFCEALAVQLSWAAGRNDMRTVQSTLGSVVERNDELLSAAIRTSQNVIKVSEGDHSKHWTPLENGMSTATHVQVPILDNGKRWGTVELSFMPLEGDSGWALLTRSSYSAVFFMVIIGFGFYFLFLRRALKELDPNAVIPERVKAAFDVLSEGLLIVDNDGRIVLANKAFSDLTGLPAGQFTGRDASNLDFMAASSGTRPDQYPWELAISNRIHQTGVPLMRSDESGRQRILMVNGSPILDGAGETRGALATFDDVTDLEKRNTELRKTLGHLSKSRAEVKRQNEELRYLATRDPLTSCLNRRAAFERFEHLIDAAAKDGGSVCCIMVDIDHFKQVNDRYGHAAGDKVIQFVARKLRESCRPNDIVARYGGEEFLLVLPSIDMDGAAGFADRLRVTIHDDFAKKFSSSRALTVSMGIAMHEFGTESALGLVNRADTALYAAKASGRNRVVRWDDPILSEGGSEKSEASLEDERSVLVENLANMTQSLEVSAIRGLASGVGGLLGTGKDDGETAFDDLTGLPNRMLFYDRVSQAVSTARRDDQCVGIISADVSLFRGSNDSYESAADDALMQLATARLSKVLRQSDVVTNLNGAIDAITISRLDSNEFGIALAGLNSSEAVTWVIQRIFDTFAAPIMDDDDGNDVFADCTIGVSLYPNDGKDIETLIRRAVTARHHATESFGRHKFMFYAQEMNSQSFQHLKLQAQLRESIEKDELVLHYQPAFDIDSGRIATIEALIRWQHPEMGLLGPDVFIPIAEYSGFINEIGAWVLRQACTQMMKWVGEEFCDVRMAVNLSAIQMKSSGLKDEIFAIVDQTGMDPKLLELEVTETALMDNVEHAQNLLQDIRELGIHVAIDDFGTGFSSLSHLKHFYVDKLKIDQSFIHDVVRDNRDAAVVGATIAMAKLLNATVTAEGVETKEQLAFLRKRKCDIAQGFFLSKPVDAAGMEKLIEADVRKTQSFGKVTAGTPAFEPGELLSEDLT